jgi:NlpE N-terminal domain/Aspartic acid proteinase inhibitor
MSWVRILAAALCLSGAGWACRSTSPLIDAADGSVPAIAGIFSGTLPCADCSGIRTDITLFTIAPARRTEGSFTLVEQYLGTRTGDRTFRRYGRWVTIRGTASDPAATVYQLTSDDGGRVINLRRIDDNAVRLLADDQSELPSDLRHTLRRPGPSVLGGYREVDASLPDVREAADYAVSQHAARTGTTLSMRHVFWAASQVAGGVRYRLCIETTAAGVRKVVTAVVFRTLDQQLSLSDWIEGCEPIGSL